MSLHSCSVFTHVHIAYWSHMKCLWFRNKWILLCVISGTIGWLPPQCVAAQRQCCSPGRSQLLPPLTCSTSCSTDARKKSNQSLRNPVTKKCMVFNRRKSRNKYRNKSILWVPTSNRPIVREGFISRQVSGLLSGPDHQHYSHIISPAFTWEKAKL